MQVDVHVGTLSKAFGGLGGFVSTSRDIKEMLVNKVGGPQCWIDVCMLCDS